MNNRKEISDMHILDLTIKCKDATGDGNEIVCMNDDYIMRITAEDCGTFTNAPTKKLIIRHGAEYYEVDVENITREGQTFLGADLPKIRHPGYCKVGVIGEDEDGKIIYDSKYALYKCTRSSAVGAIIPIRDPVLQTLNVTTNGTYEVPDDVDGYNEVIVNVPAPLIEGDKSVVLSLADSDQVIEPYDSRYTMSKVTVLKPLGLTPENIREGVQIAGITGTLANAYVPESEVANITPTAYAQEILPTTTEFFNKVIVNPIPSEYIIPSGKTIITENNVVVDVRHLDTVEVCVTETNDADEYNIVAVTYDPIINGLHIELLEGSNDEQI